MHAFLHLLDFNSIVPLTHVLCFSNIYSSVHYFAKLQLTSAVNNLAEIYIELLCGLSLLAILGQTELENNK